MAHRFRSFFKHLGHWSLVPLHLSIAIAFACLMIFALDGATSERCQTPMSWWRRLHKCGLSQSDITTLISAGLVVQRTVTTAWVIQSAWTSTYIALERVGLTLKEAAKVVSFHLPPITTAWKEPHLGLILLIFLLLLPVQFISPLASGSVTWKPASTSVDGELAELSTFNTSSLYWTALYFSELRYDLTMGAASRSVQIQSNDMFDVGKASKILLRRRSAAVKDSTIGTTFRNVTMPYISIHSVDWLGAADVARLPGWVISPGDLTLDFSQSLDPLRITSEGLAAVMKPEAFSDSTWYRNLPATPPSQIFTGVKYVLLALRRINNVCQCPDWSPTFGPISDLAALNWPSYNPDDSCFATSCLAVAKVNLTVGQTKCRSCHLTTSGVIETSSSRENLTPNPDPWVDLIFDMLPEVMSMMTVMNTTAAQEFDNPEGYLRGFISQAYQSSWNAIVDQFSYSEVAGNQLTAITTTQRPQPAIQAQVSRSRIIIWLSLNLLLPVSALLLGLLQSRCRNLKEPTTNFIVNAFLSSPTDIFTEVRDRDQAQSLRIISHLDETYATLVLRPVPDARGPRQEKYNSILSDTSNDKGPPQLPPVDRLRPDDLLSVVTVDESRL